MLTLTLVISQTTLPLSLPAFNSNLQLMDGRINDESKKEITFSKTRIKTTNRQVNVIDYLYWLDALRTACMTKDLIVRSILYYLLEV